ncbi:hypothetical protein EJ419_07205 [Alloscardovia theropitheci]|uniref:Uncharacterized protein n=1 Tax=Alloscardovia theropitheci TaxID=2496842 RepID=A0A4R0QYX8_9BIFI|nr:hypothetical protein [Alloscardovia theropitheci]TCD53746.1 hypothetical protein EJ419_07205 [Alloscardovia theropitheci]
MTENNMKNGEMSEKEFTRLYCSELDTVMSDIIPQCVTDVDMSLKNIGWLTSKQKRSVRASFINRAVAKACGEHALGDWTVDESGYTHLTHKPSGLKIRLRSVDKKTGRAPHGGNTFAARARYNQGSLLGPECIQFGVDGIPDLSGINLMLVCDYEKLDSTFMTIHRPIENGKYGSGIVSAYSYPLERGIDGMIPLVEFVPDQNDSVNVLDFLAQDEDVKVNG